MRSFYSSFPRRPATRRYDSGWRCTATYHPRGEQLESRMLLTATPVAAVATVRPIDEIGNNVSNSMWGVASTDQVASDLLRLAPPAYSDGISAPSLPQDITAPRDQQYCE